MSNYNWNCKLEPDGFCLSGATSHKFGTPNREGQVVH